MQCCSTAPLEVAENTHPLPARAAGLKLGVRLQVEAPPPTGRGRPRRPLLRAFARRDITPGGRTVTTGRPGGRRRTTEASALPSRPPWICALQRGADLSSRPPLSADSTRAAQAPQGVFTSTPRSTSAPHPAHEGSHRERPEYHQGTGRCPRASPGIAVCNGRYPEQDLALYTWNPHTHTQ